MNSLPITYDVTQLFELEDALKAMPQIKLETLHHFAPGVYVRELRIPAGVCLTGAVHKTEHLNICVKGVLRVVSVGMPDKVVSGGEIFTSPSGTKRAAYVESDAVWLTVHATEETDIDKLEQMLVHNDRDLLFHRADRESYERFVIEFGITNEFIELLSNVEVHYFETENVELRSSLIHGIGVFALQPMGRGDFIAPSVIDGIQIEWGRYTNHAANPNARIQVVNSENIHMVAALNIDYGDEITLDYGDVLRSVI